MKPARAFPVVFLPVMLMAGVVALSACNRDTPTSQALTPTAAR